MTRQPTSQVAHVITPTQAVFEALQRGLSRGLDGWTPESEERLRYHLENGELGQAAGLELQVTQAHEIIQQIMRMTAEQTYSLLGLMNDSDVDTLTAVCDMWRRNARTKEDWVYVPLAEIVKLCGIKPQNGDTGAYRIRDRERVQDSILRLAGTYCYELPLTKKRYTRKRRGNGKAQDFLEIEQIRQSPVFMVRDRFSTRVRSGVEEGSAGGRVMYGAGIVLDGVEIQPGPLLAEYLWQHPEEWALLATKALVYKDALQVVEKRLTRHLGLIYRRRFKAGTRTVQVGVEELIDVTLLPKEPGTHPKMYKRRLEKALNTLLEDRVIGSLGWSYEHWDDAEYGLLDGQRPRHGWYQNWLQATLNVAIEDHVYGVYLQQGIQALAAPDREAAVALPLRASAAAREEWTSDRIKALRARLKMGQRAFAAALKVTGGYISQIENDKRSITADLTTRLDSLVREKMAELMGEDLRDVAPALQDTDGSGAVQLLFFSTTPSPL